MLIVPALELLPMILLAILFELIFAWPFFKWIGHPVQWVGKNITYLDNKLNLTSYSNRLRFWLGLVSSLALIAGYCGICALVLMSNQYWLSLAFSFLVISSLIATGSLREHLLEVLIALENNDINLARAAVGKIVGRNTKQMNQNEVATAALESLAENTSDGIIAPLFWCLLLGPVGIVGYKAINTLDSMIAYRNDRYEFYGKAAAKLDDLVNYIPARLTALMFLWLKPIRFIPGVTLLMRDAKKHLSPNAGWPETAMACVLDVRLGGPKTYPDGSYIDISLNQSGTAANTVSLHYGLKLFDRLIMLITSGLALSWLLIKFEVIS